MSKNTVRLVAASFTVILASLVSTACVTGPCNCEPAPQIVSFQSGTATLHGRLYVPQGKGPFPAVVYNHGNAPDNEATAALLGPVYAKRGWIFFMPERRGDGLSAEAGPNIFADSPTPQQIVDRLAGEQHDDVIAGEKWLARRDDVRKDAIAVQGNFFGGVETVLEAERGGYCAAIVAAGATVAWGRSPELQARLIAASKAAKVPLLFFQAENDSDFAASREMSKAATNAGHKAELKFYPAFGKTPQDGHTFAYKGVAVWSDDVFSFLARHCLSQKHEASAR